jgi:hypothetical protein
MPLLSVENHGATSCGPDFCGGQMDVVTEVC